MMAVSINKETCKDVGVLVELELPIWRWQVIMHRADAMFGGNLGVCLSQLLNVGFMNEIKLLDVVGPSEMN